MELRVGLASAAIHALLVWDSWGRWGAVAGLVVSFVAHSLLARGIHAWQARSPSGGQPDTVVAIAHGALNVLATHLAHWSPASWLVAPFHVLAGSAYSERVKRRDLVGFLAANGAMAALDGAPRYTIALQGVLCVVLYVLWTVRARILREALAELRAERAKLDTAQRQLLHQEKMSSLGMLAAGVAHEINNPMSYVGCNLRALAEDLPRLATDPELLREYRDEILPATLDGIERVNAIGDSLRRFARGDTVQLVEFDLNREISAALRIARSQTAGRCTVDVTLGELPRLRGLPQEVTQVAVNLIVNAAQAIGERGTIRLSTAACGGEVALTVADDGCGMSQETLAHLFEPFFTTKPVGQGTGLGLAVAHGIVKRHGGRIEVVSELGRGSTFTVWFPKARPGTDAVVREVMRKDSEALAPQQGPLPG